MIPAAFDYEVAESVDHALGLLAAGGGDAKLLAGGHSLIPAMKLRLARPAKLIDIGRLDGARYIRDAGDHVAVGALTTHASAAGCSILREHCPIVAHVAGQIGDPQVRHRGTIGGTLAHGDAASDLPAAALALGADLVIRGPGGERVVSASAFFTGVFQTAVGVGEMLVEVRFPKLGAGTGWAYEKAHRRAQDWATVAVAAVATRSNGSVTARVALVNMGGTPLRAGAAEAALDAGASAADAAALVTQGTTPPSDHSGSSAYRSHLATVLARRAIERALAG